MTDDFNEAPEPVLSITFNEAPEIEPGMYPAVLTGLERRMGTDDAGSPDPYWSWQFAVTAGGETYDLRGSSSTARGPNSKAFAWVTALLGASRMQGSNIELDIGAMLELLQCVHQDRLPLQRQELLLDPRAQPCAGAGCRDNGEYFWSSGWHFLSYSAFSRQSPD